MADPHSGKPFSPGEVQKILHHLQQPAVFTSMTRDWPALQWTAQRLSGCLGDKPIRFRLGRKEERNEPLFETHCAYAEATLEQFLSWAQDDAAADAGPFCKYLKSEYWAYADYKYIAMLFQDLPSMFEDVKWSDFGFEGRNGRESTLWVGTEGANTPCHQDAYGYNLVLQVQGRKRWHLFPPEDTSKLYPTRIPYEESSVFSQVDVLHPDLSRFPTFSGARPHVVTLQPGQVLYVPTHWWHYVESVDPITVSINSWIELELDDITRVSEAVTKAVVFALKGASGEDNTDDWLNPTEEGVTTHPENMQYLNLALRAVQPGHCDLTRSLRDNRAVKRDSRGLTRKSSHVVGGSLPFSIPFGPYLTPVRCRQGFLSETGRKPAKDPDTSSDTASKHRPACPVRNQQQTRDSAAPLTQSGPCICADETSDSSSGDCGEPVHRAMTTNDLLDCLVHPDVIARVTELLLERHTGKHGSTTS